MKTKHLLFSSVIFSLLLGGWGLSEFCNGSDSQTASVYQPREANQGLSDGMMEYMRSIKADPTTGKIDPDDVMRARKEVASASNRKAALNLDWIELGPDNVGGRTRALLIDKDDSTKIYAGGVSGGLFVSEDAGGTWSLYNDSFQNINISCITQTDDGRIFIGTGAVFETANGVGGSGAIGGGIYEVTGSGGISLITSTKPPSFPANTTSYGFGYVNQMVSYGNRIYAATNDGLKYTDDYGASWTNPVYNNGSTGSSLTGNCLDVDVASDGFVLIALNGKVYTSPNGNDKTFTGPHTFSGGSRVETAIAPSDPNIMYASVIASNNCLKDIYQSSDKGQTWDVIGPGGSGSFDPFSNPGVNCQGYYDNAIAVFPDTAGKILLGGVHLWMWEQSQANPPAGQWTQVATTANIGGSGSQYYVHADKHRFKFLNGNTVYIGSDGGVGKSTDGAQTFTENNNKYNVTQFYSVAFANDADIVMGGTQDNGTQMIGLHKYGVPGVNSPQSGFRIRGGDGFDCDISQMTPFAFSTVYNGALSRHDFTDQSATNIWNTEMGDICSDACGPFHTVIRLWESFYDPNTQDSVQFTATEPYGTGQTITYYSETNEIPLQHTLTVPLAQGDSILLPDYVQSKFVQANVATNSSSGPLYMTKDAVKSIAQPEWYRIAGNQSVPDPYGGRAYCTEFSNDGNHLFVGQSGGRVYRVSNLSYVGDSVTGDIRSSSCVITNELISKNANSLPSQTVTGIAVDPNNPDNIIVTLGNYGSNTYVYRCTNATSGSPDFYQIQGSSDNLPAMPVYDAVIDVNDKDNVILATEFGVWASDNAFSASSGSQVRWYAESKDMANAPTHAIRQQTLPFYQAANTQQIYIGTHGRGIWKTGSLVDIKINEEDETTKFDPDLKVYPNPMSNNGFVEFNLNSNTDARLIVFDISGKMVIEKQLTQRFKGKNKSSINVSDLRRGTYIIKLQAGKDSDVAKFIVN